MSSIDPGVAAYVAKARKDAGRMAGIVDLTPDDRRLRAEILARLTAEPHPAWLSTHTTYITLPGREIPVRIYNPGGEGPRPAIIYFHGGSWIAGSPESHDFITASLAANTGAMLLSVHYRRAPENPYPAPTEDCYAALLWAAARAEALGIDPDRIAIAGDSAGANLAAACTLMTRDRGGPTLCHQTLLYPTLDDDLDTPSYLACTDPILTRTAMREALDAFLPNGAAADDGYALPMRAPSLRDLPPACLSIAALDPLRDDGLRYAARLEEAGVPVLARVGPGLIHGYARMRRMSAVAEAEFQAVCAAIRAALDLPEGPAW
ncbi:alpha/beta hydrolase [Roseomonas xinghualingensis]|uniref:alpha/beta hydrolase n=1 Tax=Roseomonas xinghualingensis TaxID=2986475 RepID=UPI0021F20C27|nr:alpha/beta hydrolase fold domain-containing protein [Roseomonas sp. SXEYE001]MCV4206609.1 alpha/beta hydrolase fold domain-containing protein [Roseomonas sp. SXEYE001]